MRFSRIGILALSLMLMAGGVAAGLSGSASAQKADRPMATPVVTINIDAAKMPKRENPIVPLPMRARSLPGLC
jgi:hypothetical protein